MGYPDMKLATRIVCHQTLSGWPIRAATAIAKVWHKCLFQTRLLPIAFALAFACLRVPLRCRLIFGSYLNPSCPRCSRNPTALLFLFPTACWQGDSILRVAVRTSRYPESYSCKRMAKNICHPLCHPGSNFGH